MKRDFNNFYHQPGVNLIDSDKTIAVTFGENSNYYQIRNTLLDIDLTIKKIAVLSMMIIQMSFI